MTTFDYSCLADLSFWKDLGFFFALTFSNWFSAALNSSSPFIGNCLHFNLMTFTPTLTTSVLSIAYRRLVLTKTLARVHIHVIALLRGYTPSRCCVTHLWCGWLLQGGCSCLAVLPSMMSEQCFVWLTDVGARPVYVGEMMKESVVI